MAIGDRAFEGCSSLESSTIPEHFRSYLFGGELQAKRRKVWHSSGLRMRNEQKSETTKFDEAAGR